MSIISPVLATSIISLDKMFFSKEALEDDLISTQLEYKIIKHKYSKNKKLDEYDRNKLAKLVINNLLIADENRLLSKQEYILLSQLIVEIFDKETAEIYYSPAAGRVKAGGKLLSALMNFRTLMSDCGFIERKSRRNKAENEDYSDVLQSEKAVTAEKLLATEGLDITNLEDVWRDCYALRSEILNQQGHVEYLKKYHCLRGIGAIKLLILDAEISFNNAPGCSYTFENMAKLLKQLAQGVLQIASSEKKQKADLQVLVNTAEKYMSDEVITTLVGIQAIPCFFPAKRLRNTGSTGVPKKTTNETACKSFMPLFNTPEEARTFYTCHDFGSPRIHFIGTYDDSKNIKAIVNIDEESYEFHNIVEGIHFCFCTFFALKLKYPNISASFWLVVQQMVYTLHLECDKAVQVTRNISFKSELSNIFNAKQ